MVDDSHLPNSRQRHVDDGEFLEKINSRNEAVSVWLFVLDFFVVHFVLLVIMKFIPESQFGHFFNDFFFICLRIQATSQKWNKIEYLTYSNFWYIFPDYIVWI